MNLTEKYYNFDGKNPLFLHHSPILLRDILTKIGGVLNERESKQQQIASIRNFLGQQRGYTLYKNSTRKNTKNQRNPYRVYSIDQLWEMDLATLPKLSKENDNYTHILVCIDVFSRFVFARPLRTKQPREIVKMLDDIFREGRVPFMIQFDKGGEFNGHTTLSFLRNRGIKYRNPVSTTKSKCSVVEAFNKTLKTRIQRLLNWKQVTKQPHEKKWVDFLQVIIADYNRTRHSRIGIAPAAVTKKNATLIYKQQQQELEKRTKKQKLRKAHLNEGDYEQPLKREQCNHYGHMKYFVSTE